MNFMSRSEVLKQLGKSPRDGQITEQSIHTNPFVDEKGQCFRLVKCIVHGSTPLSMRHLQSVQRARVTPKTHYVQT